MNVARVKVPATTANLGPGFDCLGIALQLSNIVTIRSGIPAGRNAMAGAAARAYFRRSKTKAFPFQWEIAGAVPRSRGLGSSVTVRLGLLHGLNALSGSPLDAAEIFGLCAELEGHPDNAAPAAFGGFTIARPGAPLQRFPVGRALHFVLLIPDLEILTDEARKVIPDSLPFRDAVRSAANASAIAAAFAARDYSLLEGAFDDWLHQPYREKLIPCLSKVIAAGKTAGALGGWLSGSGSTIACATLENPERVAAAMLAAGGNRTAQIRIVRADNTGVRISTSRN